MNPLILISPGMAAGLAICLILRFYWARCATRSNSGVWREPGARNEIYYVSAHAALGGGIGLLFWLSWGFTALVQLSWWQRGIIFGLANAIVLSALPLLISQSLLRSAQPLSRMILVESISTCIAASLACSWTWSHTL